MLRRRILMLLCAGAVALLLVPVASARYDEELPDEPVEQVEQVEEPFALITPAKGELTSRFGPRWGRMHHGVDYGTLRELGVVAAAAGKVTRAGWIPGYEGYGKVVVIGHGYARETLYAHLSTIRVAVGDEVDAGAWIGNAGSTGSSTGTHLHFELRRLGAPLDPLPLLRHASG